LIVKNICSYAKINGKYLEKRNGIFLLMEKIIGIYYLLMATLNPDPDTSYTFHWDKFKYNANIQIKSIYIKFLNINLV